MDRAGLESLAREVGLDVIGVADAAAPWPAAVRLAEFLDAGRHGDMDWMQTHAARRSHPTNLWAQARTAIMAGLNYGPQIDPLDQLTQTARGAISVYAQGKDYHDVFKKKIKRLGRAFGETSGAEVKVFVDTAPLMEKPLSQRAGLGWQGKHTNLVSRAFGSWLFLGAILTTADLPVDAPETDHCGVCRRCLDICPTDAFPAPYQLDARRCLAYLSIEHQGPIPREFRAAMGNRIFGCDDCLAVCPWNKFASRAKEAALHARAATTLPDLVALSTLTDEAFRGRFAGTPIKRTGRDRFVRNVAIALGNVTAAGARTNAQVAAERLLNDASGLVRGAAVWAVWRLADQTRYSTLHRRYRDADPDQSVRDEWDLGLAASASRPR